MVNWAIDCQGDASDRMALQQVVTLLQANPEKLRTWISTFMDESKNAYGNRSNPDSCVKGVRERVITSLRSVFYNDPAFQDVFGQGETKKILKVKKTALNNMDVWAKKMYGDYNVKSTTPEAEAKKIYEKALKDYFSDIKDVEYEAEISEAINQMLDLFENSWEIIVEKIKNLETSAASSDGAVAAAADDGF